LRLDVDWSKLDAALAAALAQDEERGDRHLTVFVQLDPDASPLDRQSLSALGVSGADGQSVVCTATLSHQDVGALSEQPWVRRLVLSGQQRLTSPPGSDRPDGR
jgi:hypothetical protein